MSASFNPRARGGRDDSLLGGMFASMFQSTRPRGARPEVFAVHYRVFVSIHAPAGGATKRIRYIMLTDCFNPRARGGRD